MHKELWPNCNTKVYVQSYFLELPRHLDDRCYTKYSYSYSQLNDIQLKNTNQNDARHNGSQRNVVHHNASHL
jgi:hypothetical protein